MARMGAVFAAVLVSLWACRAVPPPPAERAGALPASAPLSEAAAAEARRLRLAATEALETGRLEEARDLVEQALALDPADARGRALRGLIRMEKASLQDPPPRLEWEEAETDLLVASRLAPEDAEVLHALGAFYVREGHAEAALEALEKALLVQPFHRRSLVLAGRLLYERGRERAALPLLERLSGLPAPDTESLHRLGHCHLVAGNPRRAAEVFARYRVLAPADPQGPAAQAFALWQVLRLRAAEGDRAEAEDAAGRILALYEEAARLAPGDATAHFNSGVLLEETGKAAAAQQAWRRALEVDPGHVPSLLRLASLLAARDAGEDEARALLRAALEGLPPGRDRRLVEEWLDREEGGAAREARQGG